jgi:acyl-lipid omega-6 desaturase (Delta-12 desaturase)
MSTVDEVSHQYRTGCTVTFAPEEGRHLKRRSYLLGVGVLLFDASFYVLALAGTIAAPHLRQRIACSIIAGFWASGLVTVAHDACHQSLTPGRWLNRILGTLAFLPSLHSYSLWQHGHNYLHHLFTNQRGFDYVWEPLSPREYQQMSTWSRARYRFFRTYIGHFFYYTCEIWWKRRFFPRRSAVGQPKAQHWFDFLFVVGWLAAISVTAISLRTLVTGRHAADMANWLEPLCLSICLPVIVSGMLSSSSEYLHHTHPDIHWFTDAARGEWTDRQIRTAVHVQFPAPLDWFMHWIMDHTAHHIQPTIPLYHLKEAQQLVQSRRADDVVTYRWSIREMRRILAACKLYDDQAGCWTDYSGRPTSTRFRPAESAPSKVIGPSEPLTPRSEAA